MKFTLAMIGLLVSSAVAGTIPMKRDPPPHLGADADADASLDADVDTNLGHLGHRARNVETMSMGAGLKERHVDLDGDVDDLVDDVKGDGQDEDEDEDEEEDDEDRKAQGHN